MLTKSHPSENQVTALLLLISQAEAGDKRYASEITLFAEGLRQTCGHNKLESLGIQWREALDYSQRDALTTDAALAAAFAPYLHSRLITHLSPDQDEITRLSADHVRKCVAALRMGIQGLIRWRASMTDRAEDITYPPDTTLVSESLCPVIRRTADDFFASAMAARQ